MPEIWYSDWEFSFSQQKSCRSAIVFMAHNFTENKAEIELNLVSLD